MVLPSISLLAGLAAWAGDSAPVLPGYHLDRPPSRRFELSHHLLEISGLTVTPEGHLLTHDDNRGVVYRLDPQTGKIMSGFTLGSVAIHQDFEAIAAVDHEVYLVTSSGRLYRFKEGADGANVEYRTYPTGVGRHCEVEGLAWEPADRVLLLACKTPRVRKLEGFLTLYRWSVDRTELLEGGISFPLAEVARLTGTAGFHASDIFRDPATGHFILVAAREHVLIEVTLDGRVLAGALLPAELHRQAEGIAILPDRTLAVSDEAAGRSRATLSLYPYNSGS